MLQPIKMEASTQLIMITPIIYSCKRLVVVILVQNAVLKSQANASNVNGLLEPNINYISIPAMQNTTALISLTMFMKIIRS